MSALTDSDKLPVVVKWLWGVLLDGCNIQRGPKSHHEEERQGSGNLARHDGPVDAIKLQVVNIVQAIDLPEGTRILVSL